MGSVEQKRDCVVDIIKAIGIVCVVLGHCGFPFYRFIYLFHMAIFFIASGYCYKESNAYDRKSVFQFIKKRIVTLWLPYALWNAIYSVLHNFFITINVYTDNPLLLEYVNGKNTYIVERWSVSDIVKNIFKALFLRGETQMGGAFWFLITLMEIAIGYCIVDFILQYIFKQNGNKVILAQTIISLIFLAAGYFCFIVGFSFAGISRILSLYILYHGGFLLKQYGISCKERKIKAHVAILIVSFLVLLFCNQIGTISLGNNSYNNPIFLLIVSFFGWQFVYELGFFIQKEKYLKKFMVCLGQNTLSVVILHFLCFKIVNYIGVLVYGYPLFLVAAFPILYGWGAWWVAYAFVGVMVPFLLSLLWKKVALRKFVNK